MTLSTQDRNLAALYFCGSREATAAQITEALPDMDCSDHVIAWRVIGKLAVMSETDFSEFAAALDECRLPEDAPSGAAML